MVSALGLAALLAVQQPQARATLAPATVLPGDEAVLTILVRTAGNAPLEISWPPQPDIEVLDIRDRSAVRMESGVPVRETLRQVTLRAARPGRFMIGPIEVRQGAAVTTLSGVELTVEPRGAAVGLAERILEAAGRVPAPPLADGEVALTLRVMPDTVVVGQQVDVLTLAWFPREVRSRLRAPPTLHAPPVTGGWVYHQHVPRAPVLSRDVNGRPYDVYVLHDAVFPLRDGTVPIGPAVVSYMLPGSPSLLGREVRHELASAKALLEVRLPAGDPRGELAVGSDLAWSVTVPGGELPLGEAREAVIAIAGQGNAALWPEPNVAWPPSLRVYPGEPAVTIRSDRGTVFGTKTFRYLIVADSAGVHRVPPPAYRYYDIGRGEVVELAAGPIELSTAGGGVPRISWTRPPPLLTAPAKSGAVERLARRHVRIWPWLIGAPPFIVLIVGLLRRHRARQGVRRHKETPGFISLDGLSRDFRRALAALVPDHALREGDRLADALRAAGVEEPVAQHAVRTRDRLRQALFGPGGAPDADELRAEVEEILRVLVGEVDRMRHGVRVAVLCGMMAASLPSGGVAQGPERLYGAGAYRTAADSFARRVAQAPWRADAWYSLGAARLAMGERGAALAAWVRAARLAPRHPKIREQLDELRPADDVTRRLTWVAPLTVAEAALIAGGMWALAWFSLLWGRRRRWLAVGLFAGSVAAASLSGFVAWRYREPAGVVVSREAAVREAPFPTAPVRTVVTAGHAVRVEGARGGWVLVERGGVVGWVPVRAIVRL